MKTQKELKRLALAAVLTAMSVAIDVFFKRVLGLQNFGVPFYAIPIVYGSILLGPIYGVLMSIVSDAFGVLIAGYGYLPLFVIAPVIWGVLPGLFVRKKVKSLMMLAVTLFFTYVLASLANTFALYISYSSATAFASLYTRISLIPLNTIIMFIIIRELEKKLRPVTERYIHSPFRTDELS